MVTKINSSPNNNSGEQNFKDDMSNNNELSLTDSGSVKKHSSSFKKDRAKKKSSPKHKPKALPEKNLLNIELKDHKISRLQAKLNPKPEDIKKDLIVKEVIVPKFESTLPNIETIKVTAAVEVKPISPPKREENFDDNFFQDKEGLFETELDNDMCLTPEFRAEDEGNKESALKSERKVSKEGNAVATQPQQQPKANINIVNNNVTKNVDNVCSNVSQEVLSNANNKIYIPNPLLLSNKTRNSKIIQDDDDEDMIIEEFKNIENNSNNNPQENYPITSPVECEETSSFKNNSNKIKIPYFKSPMVSESVKSLERKESSSKKEDYSLNGINNKGNTANGLEKQKERVSDTNNKPKPIEPEKKKPTITTVQASNIVKSMARTATVTPVKKKSIDQKAEEPVRKNSIEPTAKQQNLVRTNSDEKKTEPRLTPSSNNIPEVSKAINVYPESNGKVELTI
jgi:hypothetical protein